MVEMALQGSTLKTNWTFTYDAIYTRLLSEWRESRVMTYIFMFEQFFFCMKTAMSYLVVNSIILWTWKFRYSRLVTHFTCLILPELSMNRNVKLWRIIMKSKSEYCWTGNNLKLLQTVTPINTHIFAQILDILRTIQCSFTIDCVATSTRPSLNFIFQKVTALHN